ncbi:MAG: phage associated protein [Candidatus Magnetoglobus multicellularis str. Araruama]|uniref:Phage associated protein n=1 Tax=Candidatus Magnetoglobus multicellularis str. Araruama TaxID=890399 RepID=A0A1V1P4D4_9BACT|nr:MAG: phage associated protein [Candidatus Magnetoglobus multicellularis str. Araruama]
MEFNYDPIKTVQAAALFFKMNGEKSMKYIKLIKLLYLADRAALNLMEETITGDKYVSMNYGPVLSKVYDLINHGPERDPDNPWFNHISSPSDYCVKLIDDPGDEELCEEEEKIIETIYKTFGHINVWKLSEITHYMPEWQDPHGSAIPISIDDILKALRKTKEEIEAVHKDIEKESYFNLLLAN